MSEEEEDDYTRKRVEIGYLESCLDYSLMVGQTEYDKPWNEAEWLAQFDGTGYGFAGA